MMLHVGRDLLDLNVAPEPAPPAIDIRTQWRPSTKVRDQRASPGICGPN